MDTSAPKPSVRSEMVGGRLCGIDRDVCAEPQRRFPPRGGWIDRHHVRGRVQLRAEHGSESDGTCPDDRHGVAGLDLAVEDADLVTRGQDVGEVEDLFVGEALRDRVRGGVGERHARVLGLNAVDGVPEDPSSASQALPELPETAEPAASARGDARQEHTVSWPHRSNCRTYLLDGADGFVAEDRTRAVSGTSPLRMWRSVPQMVTASIRTTASVCSSIFGSGTSSQLFSPGPW